MKNTKQKVFVGLSGGVDSSVSALLLKQATLDNFEKLFGYQPPEGFIGYDVIGVFIKVWQPDFIECTWKEDRLDAMRVASMLDIPFITLDLEKEYKEGVIDYMIEEYRNGRTPNPDVMCNREVKFGACLDWVKKQDKNALFATGHYAQHDNKTLIQSNDNNKDQTYFLWAVKKELLPSIIFPVGQLNKSDVRRIAEEAGLPVATKRDSQGLCFVGTIDVKTLLKQYIDEKRGSVLDEHGEVIGHHSGAMFYTLGERHGFTITKKSVSDAPYFVVAKNMDTNTLIVSNIPPQEDNGNIIILEATNWVIPIHKGKVYQARGRYRAPLASVEIIDDTHIMIVGGNITRTPGQSLVLYDNERCIGGGIMK